MTRLDLAQLALKAYGDARWWASGQRGWYAVYFIGGKRDGERAMVQNGIECTKHASAMLGEHAAGYRLRLFREARAPRYVYPMYFYRVHKE